MSEPLTLPPCRVCKGTATGIHYGVNTCEACKAFFRRSLVENNKYVCPRDGDCKIINHKRANCSACRLKKCLELGMSKKAVRHGRYTVAIRTKTILEVKQLEREKALNDTFDMVDSVAKKLPEIISVPESDIVPDSSVHDNIVSFMLESSDKYSSLMESTNFTSNDTLQSSVIGSSIMSVSDSFQSVSNSLQSAIENNHENMTSLEPSSLFATIENAIDFDMFTDPNGLDIINSTDHDIENIEISGLDMFLNGQNVDTSDKIDFLELNPDELIDLTQELVDVFTPQTTTTTEMPQQHSPQSISSSPYSVQQYSPDTTTLDESMSSQFGSPSRSCIELVSNSSSLSSRKNTHSSFELEDYSMTPRPKRS
ncbi:NR1F2 [Mytilus coruscus]|uniref:NR1F2 n=1 Tax=Mytilus coruscus TaxID=42192 RepID=A0A6J8AXM1_MYTCO|nr:NR1F2 [Mytilus coruscus]